MKENFDRALRETLEFEGGYSNDAGDRGGKTMWGVTHIDYDSYRRSKGHETQDVRQMTEEERDDIYRNRYWNVVRGDELPAGIDFVVWDAGVNSGNRRGANWLNGVLGLPLTGRIDVSAITEALKSRDNARVIDAAVDARIAFLRRIGTGAQAKFLKGWLRRCASVRKIAKEMSSAVPGHDVRAALSLGSTGAEVRELQSRLRALGYPAGLADGVYGPSTRRAVILFQDEHGLTSTPGEWPATCWALLDTAKPIVSAERAATTEADLRAAGDGQVAKLSLLQRVLAFFGLGSVATGTLQSFPETATAIQNAVDPVRGLIGWASGNLWLICLAAAIGLIVLVRYLMHDHIEAFRSGQTQGDMQ